VYYVLLAVIPSMSLPVGVNYPWLFSNIRGLFQVLAPCFLIARLLLVVMTLSPLSAPPHLSSFNFLSVPSISVLILNVSVARSCE
jgi:hypothetical protein